MHFNLLKVPLGLDVFLLTIIFATLGIWILATLSIYLFIRRSERGDPERKGPGIIAVTSALLGLPVALVLGGILFALAGSVQVVDWLFDLGLSPRRLGMFTIAVLGYLFTVDSLIELFLKSVMGKVLTGMGWIVLYTGARSLRNRPALRRGRSDCFTGGGRVSSDTACDGNSVQSA